MKPPQRAQAHALRAIGSLKAGFAAHGRASQAPMDANSRAVLVASDDAVGCEVPGNDWSSSPYQELQESVLSIQAALAEQLGPDFERDGNVEDASFHDELHVLAPDPDHANTRYSEFSLRFSNFGRLYTWFTALPAPPSPNPVTWWSPTAGSMLLSKPWMRTTMASSSFPTRDTWWDRFFDYR